MPRMENNGGDSLARGASRFTFKPMGEKLTRESWDKMFEEEPEPVVQATYLFKCPVHGIFESDRVFYISGGYPQLNENAKGKCPKMEGSFICNEESEYAGFQPVNVNSSDSSREAGTVGAVLGEIIPSPVSA